jgi:hypothetical protein
MWRGLVSPVANAELAASGGPVAEAVAGAVTATQANVRQKRLVVMAASKLRPTGAPDQRAGR